MRAADSIRWSDREQLVSVKIEDIRAMDRIYEIMAVNGVDFVLFGLSDFFVSIERPEGGAHPRVMDALRETIKAANRHGKYV